MASSRRTRTSVDDLPDELLDSIFGKLPLLSQCEAKAVCKRWRIKLSTTTTRVKEQWLIIIWRQVLHWYNISQNRWFKKHISSFSLPSEGASLSCVIGELIIFRDEHFRCLACWNAATNKSQLLKTGAFSEKGFRFFGAFLDEKTSELKLLGYPHDWGKAGKLFTSGIDSEAPLEEACKLSDGECWPCFHNLAGTTSRVVPVLEASERVMHLYNVDKRSFTSLELPEDAHLSGECCGLHLQTGGSFVTFPELCEYPYLFRMMRFESERRRWVVVAGPPEEMANRILEEKETDKSFLFCCDGVENIWAVLAGCSMMLRYNSASDSWISIPNVVPKTPRYDLPLREAVYTTF